MIQNKDEQHPDDDPLSFFNKEMWEDQNVKQPRTDADMMFGQLMDAQNELERDAPNILGLAQHQPGPAEGAPIQEPSKAELPTVGELGMIKHYFQKLFRK